MTTRRPPVWLTEGVAGEFSPFEELPGLSIDGVDPETSVLPDHWRERLIKTQNTNTAAPSGEPMFTGWCLDKKDHLSRSCVHSGRGTRTSSQHFPTLDWPTSLSSQGDFREPGRSAGVTCDSTRCRKTVTIL